jgi:hypothetical protein
MAAAFPFLPLLAVFAVFLTTPPTTGPAEDFLAGLPPPLPLPLRPLFWPGVSFSPSSSLDSPVAGFGVFELVFDDAVLGLAPAGYRLRRRLSRVALENMVPQLVSV